MVNPIFVDGNGEGINGGFSDNGSLVKAFTLTIKYDGSNAMLMTGLSTNTFLMDKTPEQLWDDAFRKFFHYGKQEEKDELKTKRSTFPFNKLET